ncbi:MAG TPA: oxidoreductase [bacterium (Candidatus Stahlbacteria)]|nr:oxidoreductase [Candidatus Stahlbacteria bacterium]
MAVKNPYTPIPCRLKEVIEETPTIRTFILDSKPIEFEAGQFVELTVPGIGEAPFTPSSNPNDPENLELTIMKVGRVTSVLFDLKPGALLGIRGPYGKPYPIDAWKGKEVFIVGGGVGMAPLRSLLLALIDRIKDFKRVYLRYGARTPEDIVYKNLFPKWSKIKRLDIVQTVDVGDETWTGHTGVVTAILDQIPVEFKNSVAVACGPPIMLKFVTRRLVEAGFPPEVIYLSMEKNMSCGIGKCNHCRLGPYYVCKDGPVLTWDMIKDLKEDPFL